MAQPKKTVLYKHHKDRKPSKRGRINLTKLMREAASKGRSKK